MTRPTGDVGAGVLLAGSGLGLGTDAGAALGQALDGALAPLQGEAPDLVLLFATPAYGDSYAELLVEAARRSQAEFDNFTTNTFAMIRHSERIPSPRCSCSPDP